ncbi:hypothetical protein CTZ27_23040 [Streptomyces griseocarneus]|nr:hypothetical protein CTZ27_23040 [Streptomyces griseocarneus]
MARLTSSAGRATRCPSTAAGATARSPRVSRSDTPARRRTQPGHSLQSGGGPTHDRSFNPRSGQSAVSASGYCAACEGLVNPASGAPENGGPVGGDGAEPVPSQSYGHSVPPSAPQSHLGSLPMYPQTHGQPPAHLPLPRLASPEGPARTVVSLLGLCTLADAVSLVANALTFRLMNEAIDDGPNSMSHDQVLWADRLEGISAVAQLVLLLGAAVAFLVWFHQVRTNAEVFRPDGHRMRRGWTVWDWFVPVVNLWFPKKIANDIWTASLPYEPDGSPRHAPRTVMNWWWGLWITTLVVGRVGAQLDAKAWTLEQIRSSSGVLFVADTVDIAAAVLAVLFVRRLTALQHEKAQQGPVPAAAPTAV